MSDRPVHRGVAELEAGLPGVAGAPTDVGRVELLVVRPGAGERSVVDEVVLDVRDGAVGDSWRARGNARTADGAADPRGQVTIMSARVAELVAADRARWPLTGDQLYVDLDLSPANLPPGTRLVIGEAVVEVTDKPHLGCAKFAARFGADALRLVNSPAGRARNLRGVNTRVVRGGTVRTGDRVARSGAAQLLP